LSQYIRRQEAKGITGPVSEKKPLSEKTKDSPEDHRKITNPANQK
jgi:hypothetical protein